MKTRVVGLGCAGPLLCTGSSAHADRITVTSGQIVAATTESFAGRVNGQGTATLYALASDSSGGNDSTTAWNVRLALFNFAPSAPSPTPEPATLLMVASGLVVACRGYFGSDRRPRVQAVSAG
jgi:hypothetical protein